MKTSELIRVLQQTIENRGDIPVVACGLDGEGWSDLAERHVHVQELIGVSSPMCEYHEASSLAPSERHPPAFYAVTLG